MSRFGDIDSVFDTRLSEIDRSRDSFDYRHNCNHVKYHNYPTHLGYHHQNNYTFRKIRPKPPNHRMFNHRYHHTHHIKIDIGPPTPTPPPESVTPVPVKKSCCNIL